jgi:Zn-dependent protease with chaperone function
MAPLAQVNPLSAYLGDVASLFSTHPSTEERIAGPSDRKRARPG